MGGPDNACCPGCASNKRFGDDLLFLRKGSISVYGEQKPFSAVIHFVKIDSGMEIQCSLILPDS